MGHGHQFWTLIVLACLEQVKVFSIPMTQLHVLAVAVEDFDATLTANARCNRFLALPHHHLSPGSYFERTSHPSSIVLFAISQAILSCLQPSLEAKSIPLYLFHIACLCVI